MMRLTSSHRPCIVLLELLTCSGLVYSLLCPKLTVYNADYANCNGEYSESEVKVSWAPERPVFKHRDRDRYIFWNTGGLGWSIGKEEYLVDGRHWHKSGSDAVEPWQEAWPGGVTVKCSNTPDPCCETVRVISTGQAVRDQPLYIGVYRRHSHKFNERAVYVKEGPRGDSLFAYFFISEEHGVSLWVVGPKLGEFRAGIRNSEAGDCLHDLSRPWKFASRAGVWSDSDPSLTVQCYEGGEEGEVDRERGLFESKKLRQKPSKSPSSPAPCSWSTWGSWSSCSKSCDGGRQVRVRRRAGAGECPGPSRERRGCGLTPCTRRTTRRRIANRRPTTFTTSTTRRTTPTTTTLRTTRPTSVTGGAQSVECFTCGSLYSTEAPDCPQFDPADPAQRRTCQQGEACLYYSWQKAADDQAVIRECFPTSVLLGSLDSPVVPSTDCQLQTLDGDDIQACICTSDLCNLGTPLSQRPNTETTTTVTARLRQTIRPAQSTVRLPKPRQSERVTCYKCGSLFSSDGNSDCDEFDASDDSQQGLCGAGEVCLTYTWQKSRSQTGVVRECLSRDIVLGSVASPLTVSAQCEPVDISESQSQVTACLCDSHLCNGPHPGDSQQVRPTPRIKETPRRSSNRKSNQNRSLKVKEVKEVDTSPGLQCYSCGSLLNPDNAKCERFDRTNTSLSQTCLKGEACLMYTWRKSDTETASLRECFPTRVLLGSIQDPLKPQDFCLPKDITDDGSGDIKACLCSTDYCNDIDDVDIGIENEVFDLNRPVKVLRGPSPTRSSKDSTIASTQPARFSNRFTTTTTTRSFTLKTTAVVNISVAPRSCPPTFEQVGSVCLYISDKRVGWIEAKKECEARAASLLSLEDVEKYDSFVEFISRKTRRRRGKFWTAGNDISTEGRWLWEGAERPEAGRVPEFGWSEDGQSNSLSENCLAWSVSFGFNIGDSDSSWQGASCCNSLRFVCQA